MKRTPDTQRRTISARLPKPLVMAAKKKAIDRKQSLSAMIEWLIEREVKNESAVS